MQKLAHIELSNAVYIVLTGSGKKDLRGVAFFVLVPLVLAAMSATTSVYSRELGLGWALLYVGLLSLIPWWIGEGTTRAVWFGARRLQPPLWVICALGALAAGVFVGPYAWLIGHLFKTYVPAGNPAVFAAATPSVAAETLIPIVRAVVFWTAANYAFDRLLNYPRFRYPIGSANESNRAAQRPETGDCGLLQRLTRIDSLSEILFVKAEEHYVQVHSEHDRELIAYRFGAALDDLKGEDGFQIHRSFWVRCSGVVRKNDNGSQLTLEIRNGATVPVSRPYHALVRQAL